MALTRRSTFGSLPSIFDDIFDTNFFDRDNYSSIGSTMPSVNIHESDQQFVIEVAAPGMNKEDFRIELNDNVLSISAEQTEQKDDKKYKRQEFNYRTFRRSFTLPKTVADDKIEAKYKDGVLKLSVPKNKDSGNNKTRKIDIW